MSPSSSATHASSVTPACDTNPLSVRRHIRGYRAPARITLKVIFKIGIQDLQQAQESPLDRKYPRSRSHGGAVGKKDPG